MTGLAWRAAQIPEQIEQAFAEAIDSETGEIINDTALAKVEALAAQKVVAASDLALFVKECDTIAIAHLDSVIGELQKKRQRIAHAQEVAYAVLEKIVQPGEKIDSDFVSVSWRKSPPSVKVEGPADLLPPEFQRVIPATVEADKKKIKAALQAGQEVPGCKIVQGMTLQVG